MMKRAGYAGVFWYLISGLVIAGPAYGQKPPDFDKIVAKFKEKVETDSLYVGDNYTHRELTITKTLKNGVVSEIKEERHRVEKRKGKLYKKLIEKDGLVIASPGFKKKDDVVDIGIELLERYEFIFARNEILAGIKCWVFTFRPKENLSEPNAKDGALNRMAGEIWIDQNSLSFKKITASLLSEANISKIIGSAQLYKLDLIINAKLVEGHFAIDYIWTEYIYGVKMFGFVIIISNRHEIKEIFYEDYERRIK